MCPVLCENHAAQTQSTLKIAGAEKVMANAAQRPEATGSRG
jgi:hypothetical protein